MSVEGRPVTVLGGGIGGLTAAVALARRGAAVTLIERAPELGEVGAGLQIGPNGFVVLRALGLAGRLAGIAERSERVVLRNGRTGRRVVVMETGEAPFWRVHRADLVALLARAAEETGVRLRLGTEVVAARPGHDGVALTVAGGTVETHDFVVGADGTRSPLRAALNEAGAPRFAGQVAWRALVPGGGPGPVEIHAGPGRHLVRYGLRGGRLTNVVAVEERREWAAEGWSHPDDPAALRRAFAGFSGPVRDLLARVEEAHLWGLHLHPVARRWVAARAALVGDAAHPTLPFLAQGANLALEDAWVLAECLIRREGPAALALYQTLRRARVERAVAAARANGRNYHLGAPVAGLAHAVLRVAEGVAPGAMMRRLAWLHGHDVVRETAALD